MQSFIAKKEHDEKNEEEKGPMFVIDEDNKSDFSLNDQNSGRRYLNSDDRLKDDETESLIMSVEKKEE